LPDSLRDYWTGIDNILHLLRLLFENKRASREPDRTLRHQCVHTVSTSRIPSRQVDKSAFLPRAPVSSVVNSRSQTALGRRQERLPPLVRFFCKVPPAKRDGPADPQHHAGRASADAARKCVDRARKRLGSTLQPRSFRQTPPAT